MTDIEKIRAFAKQLVDEADTATIECGVAGAAPERARGTAARDLLALLDSLPAPTSPARIPDRLRQDLDAYATGGIRPGHFLSAVLADELFEAVTRADPESMAALPAIVAYVRDQLPAGCWGCEQLVEDWIRRPRS